MGLIGGVKKVSSDRDDGEGQDRANDGYIFLGMLSSCVNVQGSGFVAYQSLSGLSAFPHPLQQDP